jgi:DNA-binding SARP family transcriptional activator
VIAMNFGIELVPRRLAVEIDRPALLARLARRWHVPVTLVVAGAGFGKSTVLAQAYRADELQPPGLQGWLSIEPGLEDADAFVSALFAAVGEIRSSARMRVNTDPLAELIRLLDAVAPLPVCLILDDVERLGVRSSATAVLSGLIRRLPAHAHVVLASRTTPPVPLAALRAAERALELGESDLVFTAQECTALAAMLGRSPDVAHLGGWPALVRLCLARRDSVAWHYPREEVLAELSERQVTALFALALVGTASVELISEIAGFPCDLDDLAEHVPLVGRVGRDFSAHELWAETIAAAPPLRLRGLRRRAVLTLVARGDLARAGAVALAGKDWALLAGVAERLIAATAPAYPHDIGHGWLSQLPQAERARPGLILLAAADRLHGDYADRSVDALVDRCVPQLGDTSRSAALALGVVAAIARHDLDRLDGLADPAAADGPASRAARACARSSRLELDGDPEAALDLLGTIDEPALLSAGATVVLRLASRIRVQCLLLAGRPADAVPIAQCALRDLGDEHLRHTPAVSRWMAGDASGFARLRRVEEYAGASAGGTVGDPVLGAFVHASLAASWGQVSPLARRETAGLSLTGAAPRDAAFLTNARAALAVAAHREYEAAACFDAFLALHPPQAGTAERHLRRNVALGYVLDPRLRALWDSVVLGPQEQVSRRTARLLVAARDDGEVVEPDVDAELVFTGLPLPWSVELAARLRQRGHAAGARLTAWLSDRVGAPVRAELRRLAVDEPTAAGARALLAEVPIPPDRPVTIGVLGPLAVRHGDVAAAEADLRRCRVRELLQILVLERSVTRDRLVDLLWPDLDPSAGARNLRVTLSHLRRLLEPERTAAEACFCLRSNPQRVWLHDALALTVDLWQLHSRLARARAAREAGDVVALGIQLGAARSLWRGRALADLERIPGLDAAVAEIGALRLTVLLGLGELCLRTGRAADAAELAAEALALDEFAEPAHRLAIAAALARGHEAEADLAARRALAVCRELGAPPEATTRVLLRRALRAQRLPDVRAA